MAELKTKPRAASVGKFLEGIKEEQTRRDAFAIVAMMKKAAGAEPRMWGSGIVGFGEYHYVYDSGREGDWFLLGFAPRKKNLTLYLMSGFAGHPALMEKLGTYTTGGSCLYVRSLDDLHLPTLRRLMAESVKATKAREKKDARKRSAGTAAGKGRKRTHT